jgi:uncharacterized protein involved in exopolysaccharide biosynthesis
MDPKEMIGELLRLVRRRLPIVLPILILGMVAAILFALNQPSVYEARTKILVESPRISDDLARSTVNLSAPARLQLIEERLMARGNLEEIVSRLGLFDAPGLSMAARADLLRQSTKVESISTSTGQATPWGGGGAGLFAFTITVSLSDPEKAAEIANGFANAAVAQNLAVREGRARDTLAYFEAEDRRVGVAVAAKEAEIAAFKEQHADALPESLEARRAAASRLRENMLVIDRRVMELEEKLADLDAAAAGERPLDGGLAADPAEARLRELEFELIGKQGMLAPTHPEIRRLREEIAAVKALVAPKAGAGAESGPATDRRAALRRQRDQVSGQIDQLHAQRAEMEAQTAALEAAIRETPQVAIELEGLTRGLTEIRALETDVARRYAEARTGAELEASQSAERFQIIEPAEVPELPVASSRKKLVVLGAGASAAIAGGLAFLLEVLNPALRGAAQMERRLGMRPVVTIPYVYRPGERRWRRLRWIAAGLAITAGLALALPVIDRTIAPLPPAIARIATAAGLGPLLAPRL